MIDNKKEASIFRQVKHTIIDCLQDDYEDELFCVVTDELDLCEINWELGRIDIDFRSKYLTFNEDDTFVFDDYTLDGDNTHLFEKIRVFYKGTRDVLNRRRYYINNRVTLGKLPEGTVAFSEFHK